MYCQGLGKGQGISKLQHPERGDISYTLSHTQRHSKVHTSALKIISPIFQGLTQVPKKSTCWVARNRKHRIKSSLPICQDLLCMLVWNARFLCVSLFSSRSEGIQMIPSTATFHKPTINRGLREAVNVLYPRPYPYQAPQISFSPQITLCGQSSLLFKQLVHYSFSRMPGGGGTSFTSDSVKDTK